VDREERPGSRPLPPADERSAHAFADGYGEGLRDALRDVLQQASRGHTAQELRWLIESRLARVNEEVELKRRALLGPPRRPAWDQLLRSPAPPAPAPTLETTLQGTAFLFQEPRPARARAFVGERYATYGRVAAIVREEGGGFGLPPGTVRSFLVGAARHGPSSGDEGLDPGEAAGRVRELLDQGPALVYLDAFDFLVREYGADVTLRFVEYLLGLTKQSSSLLVVSADPAATEEMVSRRLARLFPTVR
jgi:hypothetical protein